MPVLIKGNIAVAGLPWSAGIGAYRSRLAERDADCVSRLRDAGAVILGLTNMDEGALGASTDNPWFGRTDNPAAPGHSAGGSSGGSAAAVAAGFCLAGLGTDTMGSVRIPASYCGVFGHKPGLGTISLNGVVPLSPTLDTVGVLAASASICRLVTAIASGGEIHHLDSNSSVRLAVFDGADLPGTADAITQALQRTAREAHRFGLGTSNARLSSAMLQRLPKLLFMLAEMEGAEVHREALGRDPAGFSPEFRALLSWGEENSLVRENEIRSEISAISHDLQTKLKPFDALLTPTTTKAAFAVEQKVPSDQAAFVAIASCLGWPATAFPVGRDPAGLPLSAQVMAKDQALCLSIAHALSNAAENLGDFGGQGQETVHRFDPQIGPRDTKSARRGVE